MPDGSPALGDTVIEESGWDVEVVSGRVEGSLIDSK